MSFILDDENKNNYEVMDKRYVKEFDMHIYLLSHIKTKSKIVLMDKNDENRVFNIAFKTPVNNSKGIPHILEHSVLCGCEKYNVKDPFVELIKSSLNTFLNAMTFPDKTCYPVASANLQDYKNLTDVYLNSVFFPNIYKNKNIFLQEGWHYEKENDKFIANGVVLNEMKGVYSDKNGYLEDVILSSLYKNTNYEFSSGGNPYEIINLTYDEFLDFHKKYYSPTNAIIYFYGIMDFNERLSYLHTEYLSKFDYDIKNVVDFNDYFNTDNLIKSSSNKLNYKEEYYNIDDANNLDNASVLSYNFMINKKKNNLDNILIKILDYVLFNQDGAIIKDYIIKDGISKTIKTTYEAGFVNGFYSIILYDVNDKDRDRFVKIVSDRLNEILKNGIDEEKFFAGVSVVYYDYLEYNKNQVAGLDFILESLDSYLYDDEVDLYLYYKNSFDIINKFDLKDKNCYLYTLIRELFIDNQYKNIVCLKPKINLLHEKNIKIDNILNKRVKELNAKSYDSIMKEIVRLKEYQEMPDLDFSCLPKLDLSDFDRNKKNVDFHIQDINSHKVIVTNENLNELIYLGININIDDFYDDSIYILGVLLFLLSKIDTKNYTYEKLNNIIDTNTGSFDNRIITYDDKHYVRFNVKTLIKNLDVVFSLLYEVMFNTIFNDKQRIFDILNEIKTNSNMGILSSGHIVALNRSFASFDSSSDLVDKTSILGIAFNMFIHNLIYNFDTYYDSFISDLKYVYFKLFNKKNFNFDCCIDDKYFTYYEKSLKTFIDKLNDTNTYDNCQFIKIFDSEHFERKTSSEAFLTANDVNFVSRAGKFDIKDYNGSLFVLSNLINFDYLWNNIRVLGGAYGCAFKFTKLGYAGFTTYRDPNLIKSDICFINIIEYIKSLNMDTESVEKTIIGSMAKFDNPLNAFYFHERNIYYYYINKNNEYINDLRCQVLDTTLVDIKKLDKMMNDIVRTNSICALVSEKSREDAKKYYDKIIRLDLS